MTVSQNFEDFYQQLQVTAFLAQYGLQIFTALLLGYAAYRIWKWPRNLPPGPRNWPIGSALGSNPALWHVDFMRLGQEYGDVFSVYHGNQ